MRAREVGEGSEEEGPNADEEGEDEARDHPCWRVLGAPEVCPIAPVGRGEEVVLQYHRDEEPDYYLAACERAVEGGDLAGVLAVVVWEAEVEDCAYGEHYQGDGSRDGC